MNLLERRLLRRIQFVPRADGGLDRHRLRPQRDYPLAPQGARRRAGVLHGVFQFLQVVRARVQFQKGAQFALRLVELQLGPLGAAGGEFHAQVLRRSAHRVALHLHLLSDDEALALQGADHTIGQRHGLSQIRSRERPLLQLAQNLQDRIVRRSIEQQLTRRIAPRIGQRPDFPAPDLRGKG